MKARESDMPREESWSEFFDPDCVVKKLGCDEHCGDVIDFGCGYGNFAVAAARIAKGTVYALDIESDMVRATRDRARAANLSNIHAEQRDFLAIGSGRPDASSDFVMLFNILHMDDPVSLLKEAHRVLRPGGKAAVIHWKHDASTPRGPALEIRPRPQQCRHWMEEAGFTVLTIEPLSCSPYHYGLIGQR